MSNGMVAGGHQTGKNILSTVYRLLSTNLPKIGQA